MLSASIIGAAASKKYRLSSPIFFFKFSINLLVVRGPVAITLIPSISSTLQTSLFIISILLFDFIFSVIYFENISLSTASACPAGIFALYAALINRLSKISISFFNKPQALVKDSDFKELLHTSSAKSLLVCASLLFSGFISYNFTFILLFARIHAHSHPASPAPIIDTTFSIFSFS